MPDSSLWDRYHQLLREYIANGDEKHLREVVSLSQERGLALETTSGRVAASVRSVLSAYASIGACSMEVDVHRQRRRQATRPEIPAECQVTLSTPELGGDSVVIEIRGRCSEKDLPIVRLDYVSPSAAAEASAVSSLSRPIEPRQLYDVLIGLLARDPDPGAGGSAGLE